MMQQQLPINTVVTLKRIPFYEVEGVLLPLSPLTPHPASRYPEAKFSFAFTTEQAEAVAFNREVCSRKKEYLFQIILRVCVCETACEQEDAFPPGLVAYINGKKCPLSQGPVNMLPRPLNISALCKLCPFVRNSLRLTWSPGYSPPGTYVVGVWFAKRLTALDLLEKLRLKGAWNAEFTANIIREKLNEDGDCDIVTSSLGVSLTCPIGKMKMVTPVRFLTCTHLQCFDATVFLQMNERKPTWSCPVCNKPALYDNLIIDGYFLAVLSSPRLSSNCTEIQLNKDGSWSSHNPTASKRPSETPNANESVQEIYDLDSDNHSLDTGIRSIEGGAVVCKTEDGKKSIKGGGSNKVILVDLTGTNTESDDDDAPHTAPLLPAKSVSTSASDSDNHSLDTGIRSIEGGAVVCKTEDGKKSIKGGGSNKVILVDLTGTNTESDDDDAPHTAPLLPAKSVSTSASDSDNHSLDTGIRSIEGGAVVCKTEDGKKSIKGGGSNKVILVDLTGTNTESDDDDAPHTAPLLPAKSVSTSASDSDNHSLDTGIRSIEGGAVVCKTEDGKKSIKGGGSNKVILVDLTGTNTESDDDDAPHTAPLLPAKSVSTSASDSDNHSLDTGIRSIEGGAVVCKTEDGKKSIKGGGSNKVILVDLTGTNSESDDDDAPHTAPLLPAKSVSTSASDSKT